MSPVIIFLVLFSISFSVILSFSSVQAACSSEQQQAILDRHNFHRGGHGSPPLSTSSSVVSVAQAYADKLAASGKFEHSGNHKYGENLYAGGDLVAGIDFFYDEKSQYPGPYGSEPSMANFGAWGHYSQLLWKGTTGVGCGCADYQAGQYQKVLVCNYEPPGNFGGAYGANVLAPIE